VTAGDTWAWKRNLADFPASDGWTLKYRFRHQTNAGFEIVATASGLDYLVSVPGSTTTAYTKGNYVGDGWVEKAAEKYTIWHGTLSVDPDFRATAASGVLDARTTSCQMYDQLMAAYQTYTATNGGIQSYTIGDRTLTYTSPADFLKDISYWEIRCKNEQAADRLRSGEQGGRKLWVRL
jgi:hypothetical protein